MRGLVRELFLEVAALGDVDDLTEAVERLAVGVLDDRHVHPAPDPVAGLAPVPLVEHVAVAAAVVRPAWCSSTLWSRSSGWVRSANDSSSSSSFE